MKDIFRENNASRNTRHYQLLLSAFILLFLPLAAHGELTGRIKDGEASMKNNHMTLWKAIDLLAQETPFTREKVEYILSAPLLKREQDESIISFEGKNIQLADQILIRNIELRANKDRQTSGFLIIDLDGKCISLQQLKSHYRMLEITEVPRGHSLNEATTYTASLSWGTLSFGFKERNPQCLSWVVLNPSNT